MNGQATHVPPSSQPVRSSSKTAGLAIASLVLGILSLTCLWVFGAIPAIICGIIALNKINRSGGQLTGQGQAIAGLVMGAVSFLLLPILAGMLLPALSAAREKARATVCINHVKTLGLAVAMYANDHDGKITGRLEDLTSYVGDEETFRRQLLCPSAKDQTHASYELLQGGKTWQSDADAVVIREIEPNHRGKRTLLYGDGHAEQKHD
jgi:prepilin-type processing-associated H-X9-DG protein